MASPLDTVGFPGMPCRGVYFVHAQSVRHGSAFPLRRVDAARMYMIATRMPW